MFDFNRNATIHAFDNYTEEHLADFDNYDALLACWPSAEITCVEALADGSVNIYC